MRQVGKLVVATQHYAPDLSTTAGIMTALATHLAKAMEVEVISGTAGSSPRERGNAHQPIIIELRSVRSEKSALKKRAISEISFAIRTFFVLLRRLRRHDVVLTVTAPFVLPYAVTAAARLRRARTVLILHDLYPDVLVMAGLLRATSMIAKAIRAANTLMFRVLNTIVVIGRDTEHLLMRYRGMDRDKIALITNWATLTVGVRPILPGNFYRSACKGSFVVGLSGNLGFTHDPDVVFESAQLLQSDARIHFLLSGWGIGFERLKSRQAEAQLPNVTLIDRVSDERLEEFLSAADIWIIPYRKNVAGVSVPSRFYNLLAIGRPVLIISEPDGEAALTVSEDSLGWVVRPGDAIELANTIRTACSDKDIGAKSSRAAATALQFSRNMALQKYLRLVEVLLEA
jgi:glycosyltransferase involved in cell wall biosynthesis